MDSPERAVARHYGRGDLAATILAALRKAGKDLGALTIDDLAPVDELHTRGRKATRELAAFAGLESGSAAAREVLDLGSGLGGPARFLAATCGCRVVGIDLVEEFCRVATMLSELTGLGGRTTFHRGSALDLPFADAAFDVVWTIQAQMNIADKARLYAEILRVLRPGGRLVFQDIVQGPGGDIHLPVPWASVPEISFLESADGLRRILRETGFEEIAWRDTTADCRAWYARQSAVRGQTDPVLGIHLVLGPDAGPKRRNVLRNLEEDRIRFVQAVMCRPAA